MKLGPIPRGIQFQLAISFTLDVVLWLYVRTHPGITGNVDEDAQQFLIEACLAAAVTIPCVTLLRTGSRWQKSVAVIFLVLPAKSLFLIGLWAVQHW